MLARVESSLGGPLRGPGEIALRAFTGQKFHPSRILRTYGAGGVKMLGGLESGELVS